jgi:putative DNA primase/helicase
VVKKDSTAREMFAFCQKSNNAGGITAMVAVARSELGVAIRIDELDADPWLLNVENGTIDLRTGELREHRREDFITKLAPVAFDPKADCPTWRKFLDTIFDSRDDLIGYMQRLVGYTITGVVKEHVLPFLYGTGANGKSTFCESAMKVLGPDYAMKAPPDLLIAKRGESHPTERADLFGKRFVACIETEAGRRMAEALVKEMTGGDRCRARWMYKDNFEWEPTHKVWLASNYKPVVIGTDKGIWRRIKLIPFDVMIPDAEQDRDLPDKLAAELPGILNWAIEGCLEWQRDGLKEPEAVRGETDEYREEQDVIGQFIREQCELGQGYTVSASRLHTAFLEATGIKSMNQTTFGRELTRRGFEAAQITSGPDKGKKARKGLRLIGDGERDKTRTRFARGLKKIKEAK